MNGATHSRLYSGAQDLQSLVDLLASVRPADRFSDYPSIADLHELFALPQVPEQTRLWFVAGDLVAFAMVDPYDNLLFEIKRESTGPSIETEIVDWGVACVGRTLHTDGRRPTLEASCRGDDGARIALLKRHGFVGQEMRTLHMARSLGEPIPTPSLPPGFTVRPLKGEHEVDALVALHRAAFGTNKMTVDLRLAMMRVPDYDRELDLLAVAPDGRLAADLFGFDQR